MRFLAFAFLLSMIGFVMGQFYGPPPYMYDGPGFYGPPRFYGPMPYGPGFYGPMPFYGPRFYRPYGYPYYGGGGLIGRLLFG